MTGDLDAAELFESHRQHLLAVALRVLHHQADAEDVVQDAWLRFSRHDLPAIDNVGGWLTTCVTRLCLDHLRRRRPLLMDHLEHEPAEEAASPETVAVLADEVEAALGILLETLTPAQRVSLVLHDVFGMPFASIGTMLGTGEEAARRQASRARARIRSRPSDHAPTQAQERAEVVQAFLSAASTGDVATLAAVLDPDVVRTADPQALPEGAPWVLRGRAAVIEGTKLMAPNASQAYMAWLRDQPVVVLGSLHDPTLVLTFLITESHISNYDVIADGQRLASIIPILSTTT